LRILREILFLSIYSFFCSFKKFHTPISGLLKKKICFVRHDSYNYILTLFSLKLSGADLVLYDICQNKELREFLYFRVYKLLNIEIIKIHSDKVSNSSKSFIRMGEIYNELNRFHIKGLRMPKNTHNLIGQLTLKSRKYITCIEKLNFQQFEMIIIPEPLYSPFASIGRFFIHNSIPVYTAEIFKKDPLMQVLSSSQSSSLLHEKTLSLARN